MFALLTSRRQFLRKRYLSARVKSQTSSPVEMNHVIQSRSELLGTMNDWMTSGGGAQDALDDTQLYDSVRAFLEHPTDHQVIDDLAQHNQDIQEAVNMLYNMKLVLQMTFVSQTMRPSTRNVYESDGLMNGPSSGNFGSEPPNIDQLSAEELVNNLDSMASAAFRNVSQEVSCPSGENFAYSCLQSTGLIRDC